MDGLGVHELLRVPIMSNYIDSDYLLIVGCYLVNIL